MKKEEPSLSIAVIILHGDTKGTLIKSIQSVFNPNYNSLSLIVIDNGSKDKSVETVKEIFPQVQIISSQENLGIASGRNFGLKNLLNKDTQYYFLMDSDIVLAERCLEELMKVMLSDGRTGVVAPIILKENGCLLSSGGKYIKFMSQPFLLGYGKKISKRRKGFLNKEVDYVTGAIALVRKEVFTQAGLFDPRFDPYGFEDIDWSLRVKDKGFKIMIAGEACATHIGEFSFFNETPERLYEITKKRFFLARKHLPGFLFLLFFLPFFFLRGVLLTSLVYLLKGKLNLIKATIKGMIYGLGDF